MDQDSEIIRLKSIYRNIIDTEFWLKKSNKKERKRIILNLIQIQASRLLNEFINGENLKLSSKLFYPLVNSNDKIPKQFYYLLKKAQEEELDFANTIKLMEDYLHDPTLNPKGYCQIISSLYKETYSVLQEENIATKMAKVTVKKKYREWSITTE